MTDTGNWTFVADAAGNIRGSGFSSLSAHFDVFGTMASDGSLTFSGDVAGTTATFTGSMSPSGDPSGTWVSFGDSGTFTGEKITSTLSGNTLSGTLTLPAAVTERPWFIVVDDDQDGSNGWIASDGGIITGGSVNYAMDNIPPGNSFVYTVVDLDGNLGPVNPGDHLGFGCTQAGSGDPCTVTINSSLTLDINLFVFP